MKKYYYDSKIGILEIIYKKNELVSLKLVNKKESLTQEDNFIKNITSQLEEYFAGRRKQFNLKLNPEGSNFQKLVWRELLKIPYGRTKSYSEIAEKIGNKNAQRAVGSACNKNPIMIIIPCHRVISKNGKISGYAYGNSIKEKLLSLENKIN